LEEYSTAASILIAFAIFVFGYLERRAGNRRQRTLDFLMTIIQNEGPVHDAHIEFATWINNGRTFGDDKVSLEEDKVLIRLLDFYDLVADTAMRGAIDKEMVILHLGGRMRTTYHALANYIQARRETLDRPGLYKLFENFVTRHINNRNV
jgi:hypothetical protein